VPLTLGITMSRHSFYLLHPLPPVKVLWRFMFRAYVATAVLFFSFFFLFFPLFLVQGSLLCSLPSP
jgi:hypothetical protein